MPKQPLFDNPVRLLREALKRTQPEFSKILGVSPTYLQKIELGARPITADLTDFLTAAFGVSPTSMMKPKGRPCHLLETEKHSDLAANIRAWQTVTPQLQNWAVEDFTRYLVPKLEVLFDAGSRQKMGARHKYPKTIAISLRLDRCIGEIVKDFGLNREIQAVLSELETAGRKVIWDRELVIETGTQREVRLPGSSKIALKITRKSKATKS